MQPQAYIEYLIHFHTTRDYFECHEVLEEHWKEEGQKDQTWVGLIQLAVGLYHQRRNNWAGAKKMLLSSRQILKERHQRLQELGLKPEELLPLIEQLIEDVENRRTYQSVVLPLTDELRASCEQLCLSEGLDWCMPSDLNNLDIIHRHTRRDRSDVIEERAAQLKLRQQRKTK